MASIKPNEVALLICSSLDTWLSEIIGPRKIGKVWGKLLELQVGIEKQLERFESQASYNVANPDCGCVSLLL